MEDEVSELLDQAIYKEIASQAVYEAAQKQTADPGAVALLKDLAAQEVKHSELLKALKDKGWKKEYWHPEKIRDLMISEYVTGPGTIEGASLQDVLIFAMKRELDSVEFYAQMMGLARNEDAKYLCAQLVGEELKHKMRLELFYDDLFYVQD